MNQEITGMPKLVAKLRWYPGDPLVEIKHNDLKKIARKCDVSISVDEVKGKDFITEGEMVYEETMKSSLEEISQTVVTVLAPTEQTFRECLRQLINKYGAPRTPYSTWGSDERAKEIIAELSDKWDSWF